MAFAGLLQGQFYVTRESQKDKKTKEKKLSYVGMRDITQIILEGRERRKFEDQVVRNPGRNANQTGCLTSLPGRKTQKEERKNRKGDGN